MLQTTTGNFVSTAKGSTGPPVLALNALPITFSGIESKTFVFPYTEQRLERASQPTARNSSVLEGRRFHLLLVTYG